MELISGPWDHEQVSRWLDGARIPVRLGVLGDRGQPLVISLWFLHADGELWLATGADADVVRHLRRDPRVGFEVGPDIPPYRGVRGSARAVLEEDRGLETLTRLLDRYLDPVNDELAGWLRDQAEDDEVAVRLTDLRVSSWDFSARMAPQESAAELPTIG